MKTLAVLTGPQGSGNHLWSKIFSLHEDVFGWKSLLDNYWEPRCINSTGRKANTILPLSVSHLALKIKGPNGVQTWCSFARMLKPWVSIPRS